MEPWLKDNADFQREMAARAERLSNVSALRQQLKPNIRMAQSIEPCALNAVDAATVRVPLGDQISILLQTVRVDSDGATHLGAPERITGIDGHEFRLAEMPMRLAAECRELAAARVPTIADTSYWSFLMEANQAITRCENSNIPALKEAVKQLIDDGAFLAMVQNSMVVPMSKTSQSSSYIKDVSDRHILTQILKPGEYIQPRPLVEATGGKFGIEKRRFKATERELLNDYYKRLLGVLFYKPHPWSRAFRIEGHLERLQEDRHWLMALLSAIKAATETNRIMIEPWPQYMADYTAKRLSSVARLYGDLNWHRHTESNYLHARTGRIK